MKPIAKKASSQAKINLFNGDCAELLSEMRANSVDLTLTSPPYCMGKEYESSGSLQSFIDAHEAILPQIVRVTKMGGHICWQVGYHVQHRIVAPLDFYVFQILAKFPEIVLRNRIIWTFGHGHHETERFSGRHEVILWFTKGTDYSFDLDAVRVPQKYPGKRHYKGPNKGALSGNPLGKNPGDVWDIPHVKGGHSEKTAHPCQFPVGLASRVIASLSPKGGLILDPYAGSGSTGVAAILSKRRFVGAEISKKYCKIAQSRFEEAVRGKAKIRSADKPVYVPTDGETVAKRPAHFRLHDAATLHKQKTTKAT